MKYFLFPVLFSCVLLASIQAQNSKVNVIIPTAQTECEYIWQNLRDILFFEQYGYNVAFPEHPLINELKEKSRQKKLTDTDYNRFCSVFTDSVYNTSNYQKGFEKVNKSMEAINKSFKIFKEYQKKWNFNMPAKYDVVLTLYGPGGSYDPDNGRIILFTTATGNFKTSSNPSNTIIHEMVHIGIEKCIVTKYKLSHALKEQIVDLFVLYHFKDILPDYRLQNFGESGIEKYLKTKNDFKKLPQIIEKYQNEKI